MHRRQVLFESEKALLPASQHLVQNFRTAEAMRKRLRDEEEERKTLMARLQQIDSTKYRLRRHIHQFETTNYNQVAADDGAGPSSGYRAAFIMPCPAEDCRGFLSSAYKCGTCNSYACPQCLVSIGEQRHDPAHVCDSNAVETVKTLKKDTKNCPSCGTGIYKISGCDQMFCTACKASFDWRSGRIVAPHETLHNPHYFEWLRTRSSDGQIPRQPGDNPEDHCNVNQLPRPNYLRRQVFVTNDEDYWLASETLIETRNVIYFALQQAGHVQEILNHRLRLPPADENLDLRRKFLMGEIDEAKWKQLLFSREKKKERIRAFRDVYQLFLNLSIPIFYTAGPSAAATTRAAGELADLFQFISSTLDKVAERFKAKVPHMIPKLQVPGYNTADNTAPQDV